MHPNRFLALFLLIVSGLLLAAAGSPPPTPASPETKADLSAAFSHRLQAAPGIRSLTFDLFTPELDTAFISLDGKTAVMWLALREDSGRLLATEPGLALARRSDAGWQVLLPGDPGWNETLAALPDGMLPLEHSPAPNQAVLDKTASPAALTGYYLPYAAGAARWLEGSISHFQSIPELGYPSCAQEYCQYAYDFTDTWHFPLLASKDGTLFASRDTCSDGNTGCTNYIVLLDTSQQTYQWRTEPGTWDAANTLTFPASQRSTWFAGQPGVSYAFRLRAVDVNNQSEPWPAGDAAETSVTLPGVCTPDAFEPDDDLAQASALAPGEWAQRNLCGPGNPDWFRVEIGKASDYFVSALSQNGGAAVSITVYPQDGATILAGGAAAGVGQGVDVLFRPAAAGIYYLKVDPLVANLVGTDAVYTVMVSEAKEIDLPLVVR